jgi:prolyl oligopeptidase
MKITLSIFATAQTVSIARAQSASPSIAPQPVTEDYFGTKVTDPYRNLENLDDLKVQTWMKRSLHMPE